MNRPEQQLQISVVTFLGWALDASKGFFWATPNETGAAGHRGAVLGRIRKAMGVKAGFPDLMVTHADISVPVGIELKSLKGVQTATQKAMQARFKLLGWPYYICRSLNEVQDALEDAGVPLRIRRIPLEGTICAREILES